MSTRAATPVARARGLLPWLLASGSLATILAVVFVPQEAGEGFGPDAAPFVALPLVIGGSYAFVGGLVLRRHPRHRIGWLLVWFAMTFSLGVVLDEYAYTSGLPAREWVATYSSVGWILTVLPLVGLTPLLFPTGRPLSPRWRGFAWAAILGVLLVLAGNLADPALLDHLDLQNPIGPQSLAAWSDALVAIGLTCVGAATAAGLVSLALRYRRSRGTGRRQITWFAYGAAMTLLAALALHVLYRFDRLEVGLLVFAVGALTLPASIGVAILRYRLYDIDRIVSRTVSYVALTIILASIYFAAVVGFGRLSVQLTGSASDVAVAAATLAVAALFRPLRIRLQTAVDRRFFRTRYDAIRTVEDFAHRLRDEVDLHALITDLAATAAASVAPRGASVWLVDGQPLRDEQVGR